MTGREAYKRAHAPYHHSMRLRVKWTQILLFRLGSALGIYILECQFLKAPGRAGFKPNSSDPIRWTCCAHGVV